MKDLVYDPEQVPRYYQNAYLYLRPFYNTTLSFVGIQRLNGILECGQPQEVLVDYYIDPADANPNEEIVFSYYVRLGNEDWWKCVGNEREWGRVDRGERLDCPDRDKIQAMSVI